MGNSGAVGYLFERMGVFRLKPEDIKGDIEEFELEMIDYGLEEMGEGTGEEGEDQIIIRCGFTDFGNMQEALEAKGIEPVKADSEYIPSTMIDLTDEQAEEVMGLIERLEEDDDVQKVFHNLK